MSGVSSSGIPQPGEETVVNADSTVYYTGKYWNDLEMVVRELNERATGDRNVKWWEHFWERTSGRQPYQSALFLNCGNGWVERELYDGGLFLRAKALDYSEELLNTARAARGERPIEYLQMDVNTLSLEPESFDLVVNFAAGHHVQRIDRVFREIARSLTAEGYFLNWDYVGPHRNQYPYDHWQRVVARNEECAAEFRATLGYPHLPTMLRTDPTEAIHSELIVPTFDRYFEREYFAAVGGGLAYPILTFNDNVFKSSDIERRDEEVRRLLRDDATATLRREVPTLFAYFWGKTKTHVLHDEPQLRHWTAEEERREATAHENAGEYYLRTVL